jgi:hypothetical protein
MALWRTTPMLIEMSGQEKVAFALFLQSIQAQRA